MGSGCIAQRIVDLGTCWKLSASRPVRFTPMEIVAGTHWIGGRVSPRKGLDFMKRSKILALPGLVLGPLGRPASGQWL
jgi:hypothetical protein